MNVTAKEIGSLRLCVDLKVQINSKGIDRHYPIPEVETIFHNLQGASDFGNNDLSDTYYQTELNEDGIELCAIATSH